MEQSDFSYADYIVSERQFFKKYIVIDEYKVSDATTVIRAYKGKILFMLAYY
jgi:hypothetical protein